MRIRFSSEFPEKITHGIRNAGDGKVDSRRVEAREIAGMILIDFYYLSPFCAGQAARIGRIRIQSAQIHVRAADKTGAIFTRLDPSERAFNGG